MLHDIIRIQYRDFTEKDLINPHELNIVNRHLDEVKTYFSAYNFDVVYSLNNIADYCLVMKIANWNFKSVLTDEYQTVFDEIQNYFDTVLRQFQVKRVVDFLQSFDFDLRQDYGYDLSSAIYKMLPKYSKSLSEDTYARAINQQPYLIFDDYDDYKTVFKNYPSLYDVLFSLDNLNGFIEDRLERMVQIGINICNNQAFPRADIKKRIQEIFNELGEKIVSNRDLNLALQNQIKYRGILQFFKGIASARFNYFDENQSAVDGLANQWVEEKGHEFSYELPFEEIKKQLDNPKIPWHLKQIMLTHSRDDKNGKIEHFCTQAMNIGRTSLAEMLVTSNVPTNSHFGFVTQQILSLHHSLYMYSLRYYIGEKKRWENFCINTENIIRYIFRVANVDFKQIDTQFTFWKRKGERYLFGPAEDKRENAIDFTSDTVKLVERFLREVYIAEKKNAKSFYLADKITLGILLNYYDTNNPLTKIMPMNFMQYLSFCLITDKDEKGVEVGINLRNPLMHSVIDYDKFADSNGILSLLTFTGIVNELFLYYNAVDVKRNAENSDKEKQILAAIDLLNKTANELRQLTEEKEDLTRKLKKQTAIIFALASIDENQDPDVLHRAIESAINGVLKDTPEYAEYKEILKASDAKEVQCVLKYIEYYTLLDLSRKNLISDKYMERIEDLSEQGFFLQMMGTPDIPESILYKDKNGETIGQLYALKLRELFNNVLNAQGEYSMCIENAIGLFEDGNYLACAQTLMQQLPNYINELKETLNFYRENGGVKRFVYYNGVADKVLNYYSKLETPLENWDGKSLNYFDLQRDSQSYKVTDLDCVRLFMLTSSTAELNSFFAVANFILNNPQSLREVIERLNS